MYVLASPSLETGELFRRELGETPLFPFCFGERGERRGSEGAITTEATTVELTQPSPTRTCTIADAAELSLTHATAVVVVGVVVVAVF